MWSYNYTYQSAELYHYGVLGMKWGHRKARPQAIIYGSRRIRNGYKTDAQSAKQLYKQNMRQTKAAYKEQKQAYKKTNEYKAEVKSKAKKAVKIGAVVAGTALAAYGAYKVSKIVKDKNMKIAYEAGQREIQKNIDMMSRLSKDAMDNGAKSSKYSINADRIIDKHLDKAKNDSFITAAKNVARYRKSGGNYGYRYTGALENTFRR